MPEPDLPPMQKAVVDLMRLEVALRGVLQGIGANTPGPHASPDEQAAFLARLHPVMAETQLSLALACGDLAGHLRRHRTTLN